MSPEKVAAALANYTIPGGNGSYPGTFVLKHNTEEVYGILNTLFSKRGAKRVGVDSQAALIWVTFQRCGGHLATYKEPAYHRAIPSHSIIATIPGTCEVG